MQARSKAYKTEQAEHLRNESYVWVYLGVINREAQASSVTEGTFTEYSKPQLVNGTNEFEAYYATCERNMALVDGSMFFMPKSKAYALYQGAVTQNFLAPITFRFGTNKHIDIKGLTIDFGDYYPTEFTVTNGQYTYTYTNDSAGKWEEGNDEWLESSYLTITPISMKGGAKRFRIFSILFGVGLVFDNKSLLKTDRKNTVSHLSEKLPTKKFDFTVDNYSKKFSADDPHSFTAFLMKQQEVEYEYGRMLDDGSIYRIKGGKTALKQWSSNDKQAKFSTVGILEFHDSTFNKGRYSKEGRSYYDLATEVCEDAGFEKFYIDPYLKKLTTHNPLPISKHKNLLQVIANACNCILYENRDGSICIKSSFVPEAESVTSNGARNFSTLKNLVDEKIAIAHYASGERDYADVSGGFYFMPRKAPYITSAYVSSAISNANGTFSVNPRVTIAYEAQWTFFSLQLVFNKVHPLGITVYTYGDGDLLDVYTVDEDDISDITVINGDFVDVDKIEIEFTKTQPYQRIHLDKVRTGSITDYSLYYTDLKTTPTAARTDKIKDIHTHYYQFAEGKELESLSTVDAMSGSNTVTFSDASHGYRLSYTDGGSGTLRIVSANTYALTFTSSRTAEVEIEGYKYTISDMEATASLEDSGEDKTSKNPLIDNYDQAVKNAIWLKEHFANDVEYTLSYRGEPALDCDDQIYLENKFVIKNMVRITEEQINTSQGMSMSCKLKTRRTSYKEVARVNHAIVNVSEVVGV